MEHYNLIKEIAMDCIGKFRDFPETIQAGIEIDDFLAGLVGQDKYLDFDSLLCSAQATNEEQGFVYGFCYGVQLITQVNNVIREYFKQNVGRKIRSFFCPLFVLYFGFCPLQKNIKYNK